MLSMFVLDLTGEPGTVVVSPADTRPEDDGGGDDDELEEGQVTAVVLGPVTTAIEFPGAWLVGRIARACLLMRVPRVG